MSPHDHELLRLAERHGIAARWTDAFGNPQAVPDGTIKRILQALGAGGAGDDRSDAWLPPLITTDVGADTLLPGTIGTGRVPTVVLVDQDVPLPARRTPDGLMIAAPTQPGYHRVAIGTRTVTLAVAPARAPGLRELTGRERAFGTSVQVYSLRRSGDDGIGDTGALADAARRFAGQGAHALAISPTHALFGAEPYRASPYSPSSRLAVNGLLGDPTPVLGEETVARARRNLPEQGVITSASEHDLIDWTRAAAAKNALMRRLFASGADNCAPWVDAFECFVATAGTAVLDHARFEALHRAMLVHEAGDWRNWPNDRLRRTDPPGTSPSAVAEETRYQLFLQWIASEGLVAAQQAARDAGMGIGLIADLAVGIDPCGSEAWSRPEAFLSGLTIGAPPDLLNREGQNWGLTAFSPSGLTASGFRPFIDTLRAALRTAGGLRIDHILGFQRLWVVPEGERSSEGAYLAMPIHDLVRLTLLEAHQAGALVIGEDLGTVPDGFRPMLSRRGILGLRVLPFERSETGSFHPPARWQQDAVAMTSTHDLPPVAGWWTGRDIDWRVQVFVNASAGAETERTERALSRVQFWDAARTANPKAGTLPPDDYPEAAVDAAIDIVARSACALAIVPIEDLVGAIEAPNLPGTLDEHPNWRRRLAHPVDQLVSTPTVARRLDLLRRERP